VRLRTKRMDKRGKEEEKREEKVKVRNPGRKKRKKSED
jgi:hypothetical protein